MEYTVKVETLTKCVFGKGKENLINAYKGGKVLNGLGTIYDWGAGLKFHVYSGVDFVFAEKDFSSKREMRAEVKRFALLFFALNSDLVEFELGLIDCDKVPPVKIPENSPDYVVDTFHLEVAGEESSSNHCQDCAESVALEDSHGEGDAWLCGDCYGERREAQQKRERSQAAWDLACYTVRTRSADAGFVAYCVDFLGAYTAPCKESPMGRLLEWTRWDDCVGPVRMVEGVGGAA